MVNKKERTINEVHQLLTEFFGYVKDQFGKVETRFETVNSRFEKNERILKLVSEQTMSMVKDVKELKETTGNIEKRQRHMEQDVLSIKEDVDTLAKIVGRDSSTIKSHGRRIVNLERSI